ncbi:MAG: SnoaL-like domain-containing protein [Anaerolineae bacterium]|nr:SnoaL-like domain-containing protein [Anaerolineae bacterium]
MLPSDDPKHIVAQFVEELTNQHNPAAWRQYCAESLVHHFDLPNVPPTRDGAEALSRGILAAFPDVQVTIDLLLQEGEWVVERARAVGTHTGAFMGIPASGQRLSWLETHLYRVVGGQIIECIPEVRLEMLLAQMAGQTSYFRGPHPSLLSRGIAVAMRAAASLSRPQPDSALPDDDTRQERNRAVVARYIEEFKNQQQFFVFARLFGASFRHHFEFPARDDRMASFVSVGQNFLAAFPDVHVTVQQLLSDGAYVVERNRVSATHRGPFAGVQATERQVTWTETHIYRLEDGKIVENWPLVNFERIIAQLS